MFISSYRLLIIIVKEVRLGKKYGVLERSEELLFPLKKSKSALIFCIKMVMGSPFFQKSLTTNGQVTMECCLYQMMMMIHFKPGVILPVESDLHKSFL